jgi:hypothetical protein
VLEISFSFSFPFLVLSRIFLLPFYPFFIPLFIPATLYIQTTAPPKSSLVYKPFAAAGGAVVIANWFAELLKIDVADAVEVVKETVKAYVVEERVLKRE